MPWAQVTGQQAEHNSASPSTATLPSTPTTGNYILISIIEATGTSALTSVQDGNGTNAVLLNSYTATSTVTCFQYILQVPATPNASITATLSGATLDVLISEFSGGPASFTGSGSSATIVDNAQAKNIENATVTTTSGVQPSVTTTNAGDLIWTTCAIGGSAGGAFGVTNATLLGTAPTNLTNARLADAYQVETATGTYTPYFTWTTTHIVAQLTTALLPAATLLLPVRPTVAGQAVKRAAFF